MGVTIDNFGASLQHNLPGVIETLNNTVNAKKLTKGKVKKWQGSKLTKHVHVQRSSAISWAEDGGAITPSKKQSYEEAEAYRKFCTGQVGVTDGILNNASDTTYAARAVLESELRGMMTGVQKFYNYFWTRDGTGIVTLLGATVSGATLTVDDARGLWDGGTYTCLDAGTPTTEHFNFTMSKTARAYNNTLGSATITPSASVASASQAADDYIVWGQGAYKSYNRAITGLDAGIDDAASTFQGINASTYNRWTSPTLDAVGTLTPDVLRKMIGMIFQEGGKSTDGLTAVTEVWIANVMDAMFESAVRITPDTKVAGQATPTFQSTLGRIKIETDPDSPYGTIFLIDPSQISFAVQKELHWRPATNGGGGILARSDGSLRYTATFLEQSELFYEQRNRCGKMTGITETVGTAY